MDQVMQRTSTPGEEETVGVGRRYVECVQAGRLDRTLFASDFVFHGPTGPPMDLDTADQALQYFAACFPDHRTTVEAEVANGGTVVYRWTTLGTHEGEFLGIPPTGKEVVSKGMTMIAASGGQVTEIWESADFLGFMQQLGAIPSEPMAG